MAEQDLLAQANAAKALGDQFAPPVGSVVQLNGWAYKVTAPLRPGAFYRLNGSRWYFDVLCMHGDSSRQLRGSFCVDDPFEVTRVPRGSPPFEDWQRVSIADE